MRKKKINELQRVGLEQFKALPKVPLVVVLDDVRSLYNVGSIFRTADAFCLAGIALCGITACPPHPEIHKTALGAENAVEWRHFAGVMEAIDLLRGKGYKICAIEQAHGSVSLQQFIVNPHEKYAVVFGNEVRGVHQEAVDKCDCCIEIPQYGTKHSLNVSIAAGITMWHFFTSLYGK